MLCYYDQAAIDSENSHLSHKCGGVDQQTQTIPTNSGSFLFKLSLKRLPVCFFSNSGSTMNTEKYYKLQRSKFVFS